MYLKVQYQDTSQICPISVDMSAPRFIATCESRQCKHTHPSDLDTQFWEPQPAVTGIKSINRKICNIRCTKSQILINAPLVFQLSLPNPLKFRMKM